MAKPLLDAQVCREIVQELLQDNGPLSVGQIQRRIERVFRVNGAYLAMTLCCGGGGFVIDDGVVYAKNTRKKRGAK